MSNRMRKELDGFSAKIRGEQISDFPCYLLGQLSKNSNAKSEELSGKQLIDFARIPDENQPMVQMIRKIS